MFILFYLFKKGYSGYILRGSDGREVKLFIIKKSFFF